ncbi:MAG: hypothetical protein PHX88_12005 [Methanoculleus horonobensis]|nr:hypothetical protein [Methanoculleus horonobensis]MDD4253270.1 hypothetical protein [Methanoculleus horonobensis]
MIEADGWYLVATRGSHRQYKHPSNLATSGCSCSVPSGTSHQAGSPSPGTWQTFLLRER